MNYLGEILKLLGGLAGLIALAWRVVDEFGTYLRMTVTVYSQGQCRVLVRSVVDNKGNRPKRVSYAFLLLGPESEGPIETANRLAPKLGVTDEIVLINQFGVLKTNKPIYADGRALIPLPFFYRENIRIFDETLAYVSPVTVDLLQANTSYSARFYLFADGRLPRSTQDCFFT